MNLTNLKCNQFSVLQMSTQVFHCRALLLRRLGETRASASDLTRLSAAQARAMASAAANGQLNGDHRGPRPLVLCGPSGAGKTSIMRKLTDEFQNTFGFSVSHTTRSPRAGESDGVDYHFVTKDNFVKLIEDGAFLEHAVFGGNMYGTSRVAVENVRETGKICILDIDVQGVKSIKKTDLNPDFVFIKPQRVEDLEPRLRKRGTETEDSIKRRLSVAAAEIAYGDTPGNFDIVIENYCIDTSYSQLRGFMLPKINALNIDMKGDDE